MTAKQPKFNWFFDMDGVINVPDAHYRDIPFKEDTPVLAIGRHYFRDLDPCWPIIHAIQALYAEKQNTYVLSATTDWSNPMMDVQQLYDKSVWLARYLPGLPASHILWSLRQQSKPDTVLTCLDRPLSRHDILVDDYGRNCAEWQDRGGTAIKFLRQCDKPVEDEPRITIRTDGQTEVYGELMKIQHEIENAILNKMEEK